MPTAIPLCEPFLGGREQEYVKNCLTSGWVSSVGKYVELFEERFAERHPGTEAVAVASGTAALHLALLSVGVLPGEEVLVSSLTFIAPANAVRYAGASPVFIDADPDYWQMDPLLVAEFLDQGCERRHQGLFNRVTGRRVSAILPVHILGHPADMDALMEIAQRHDLKVVEDATESLGATVKGLPVGTIGHVGCFSFNGNKLMTTGGGGMVISKDPEICKKVRYLSTQAKEPGNEYIHHSVGYNYRLTNIQAAIGCAQLEQLDGFLAKKANIANKYTKDLQFCPGIQFQKNAVWAQSAYWLYTILINPNEFGIGSRRLIDKLSSQGINTRPLWQPMHKSKAHYADKQENRCNISELLYERAISLPSSTNLSIKDQERVIWAIRSSMNTF
jgi:perosamine synthetase